MKNTIPKCVICDKAYTGYGHNAMPEAEGKCCDYCNNHVVMPRRITDRLREEGKTPEEIMSVLREIYIIEEKLLGLRLPI